MSPSTFSSAALPPGMETTQRIRHPPTCLPCCLDNTNHPLLSLLTLPLSHLALFFHTFFYGFSCSSVTPFIPALSLSCSYFFHLSLVLLLL